MPQPAGQPATQTNELHGKDARGSPDRGELGPPTPTALIPCSAQLPPHSPFALVLPTGAWGWGAGRWQEGEEGVRAQLSLFSESPGRSRAGSGERAGPAQAWGGSWQRRHRSIPDWYCSSCRVQLENPNREQSREVASARTASGSAVESVGK